MQGLIISHLEQKLWYLSYTTVDAFNAYALLSVSFVSMGIICSESRKEKRVHRRVRNEEHPKLMFNVP